MKKSNVKVLLGSMLILALLSCEKNTTEECTLKFCLDTLSSNETELLYYPVIDVHLHIYSNDSYYGSSSFVLNGIRSASCAEEHFRKVLVEMDTNNVVLSMASSRVSTCNDYYDNFPGLTDRFIYSCCLFDGGELCSPPPDLETQIIEKKIGAIGELSGIYSNIPYHDSIYRELFQLANEYSLTACIHTGIVPFYAEYPDYSFALANPATLDTLLTLYPNVNMNAAHWGISNHPDYNYEDDMIRMLKEYDNMYCDIGATAWFSADGIQKTNDFLKRAIQEGLEDKILYGSDEMVYPGAITRSINYVKDADFLTVVQKKKILYWNAARFFSLPEEEVLEHFTR